MWFSLVDLRNAPRRGDKGAEEGRQGSRGGETREPRRGDKGDNGLQKRSNGANEGNGSALRAAFQFDAGALCARGRGRSPRTHKHLGSPCLRVRGDLPLPPAGPAGRRRVEFRACRPKDPFSPLAPLLRCRDPLSPLPPAPPPPLPPAPPLPIDTPPLPHRHSLSARTGAPPVRGKGACSHPTGSQPKTNLLPAPIKRTPGVTEGRSTCRARSRRPHLPTLFENKPGDG
jgi:hypothetical protein